LSVLAPEAGTSAAAHAGAPAGAAPPSCRSAAAPALAAAATGGGAAQAASWLAGAAPLACSCCLTASAPSAPAPARAPPALPPRSLGSAGRAGCSPVGSARPDLPPGPGAGGAAGGRGAATVGARSGWSVFEAAAARLGPAPHACPLRGASSAARSRNSMLLASKLCNCRSSRSGSRLRPAQPQRRPAAAHVGTRARLPPCTAHILQPDYATSLAPRVGHHGRRIQSRAPAGGACCGQARMQRPDARVRRGRPRRACPTELAAAGGATDAAHGCSQAPLCACLRRRTATGAAVSNQSVSILTLKVSNAW